MQAKKECNLRMVLICIMIALSLSSTNLLANDDFQSMQQKVDNHLKTFQFDSIPYLLNQLNSIASESGSDSLITESNMYHAKYFFYKSDYENAAKYMIEAAKGYELMNDSLGASKMYNNISQLIATSGNQEQMMKYKQRALLLCPKNAANWHLTLLINLSSGFRQINEMDSCQYYLEKAYNQSIEINDSSNLAACIMQHVILNNTLLNHQATIDYGNQFINKFKQHGSRSQYENVLYYQAVAYQGLKKYRAALNKAQKSTALIIESSGVINAASNYKLIAELHAALGENNLAYQALTKSVDFQDSIFNLDKQTAVLELEKKYETEKKEKENLQLKQERIKQDLAIANKNNLLLILSIVGMLILAFTFYLWNKRVQKEKEKRNKTEQQLRRAQINPHFFFNSLNSISKQVVNNEDKKQTVLYLSKFTKLMRQTLETSFNDFIGIDAEVNMLQNYLQLQKMRFKEKFDFRIENYCEEEILIPSQILQPFVENAIEHGFKNIDYQGQLTVRFKIDNDEVLKAVVEDNGMGIPSDSKQKSKHTSRALQIIKARLSLFGNNKLYYHNIESTNEGTKVTIYCPYK